MIADAANALDAQVGEAVTDGKQLIMRQHQVRRINLDITRRAKRKAALQQAKRRLGKDTNMSEGIGSTNSRTKSISHLLALPSQQSQLEEHITTLEYRRNLINDLQANRERILTLHTNIHLIVISIGEPLRHHTPCLDSRPMIKQRHIQEQQQAKGTKHPSPDNKHQGNCIAQAYQ